VRALSRACPLLERLHLMPCWDPDPFGDMEAALKRAADGWVKAANFRRSTGEEQLKISFGNGSIAIDSSFYDSDGDA